MHLSLLKIAQVSQKSVDRFCDSSEKKEVARRLNSLEINGKSVSKWNFFHSCRIYIKTFFVNY